MRQAYGTIVVIGGGCYGSYYLRQLRRGAGANAIAWERMVIVDRDPACAVALADPLLPVWAAPLTAAAAEGSSSDVSLCVAEWGHFLDTWLPTAGDADAIVPSPLMPHLCVEWLARRATRRWPARAVGRIPLSQPVGTPWESAAPDGTAYVSHATWNCPVNCIEPARCPHTRGPRDWSMPVTLQRWADAPPPAQRPALGPFTFHCTHRAYGVGMIDVADLRRADAAIAAAATRAPVDALVATASHCHGAAAVLRIGPPVPHSAARGEISG